MVLFIFLWRFTVVDCFELIECDKEGEILLNDAVRDFAEGVSSMGATQ